MATHSTKTFLLMELLPSFHASSQLTAGKWRPSIKQILRNSIERTEKLIKVLHKVSRLKEELITLNMELIILP